MTHEGKTGAKAETRAQKARRKLLYARRVSVWAMRLATILIATVVVAVAMLLGQRLHAPDWLRHRLEERIAVGLNGLQVEFGDVQFVMHEGWQPRLRLRDVVLSDSAGQPIVQLADARAALALRPLLNGRVQPASIALSGAFATLRRDAGGGVALSFGGAAAPAGQAAGITQLIAAWERRLMTPQLAHLTDLELDSLTLRYEDLRQGRAWTLDGGTLRLDREGENLRIAAGFALLSGRAYASSVEMNYESRIGETGAHIGVSVQDIAAQDIAAQGVALAWLGALRAPISGALRAAVHPDGTLGPLSATLQIGAGVLQPTDSTSPVPFDGARSYFTYDPVRQVLEFDELSVSSAWGSGIAEGHAWLNGASNGVPSDMVGQFTLRGLRLDPPGQYEEPLVLDRAGLDFRLALDPFRLTVGQMTIGARDWRLGVSGDLAAAEGGWRLALDARADSLNTDRLMRLWPARLSPKPRKWVAENLSGGNLRDIDFALRLAPGGKPELYGDFDFSDAGIRFLRTMPPITGAAGHASLLRKRFVVTATAGVVRAGQGGALDVSGTSFIVPDTSIRRAAPGVVRMQAAGTVTAVLSLLNRPPLQILKGTPLPEDMADGAVRATGTLALPLKKGAQFDEMDFHLDGVIDAVSSTVLVPDHLVRAPQLRVRADNAEVAVSGAVRIDDLPARVRWRQPIGKGAARSSRLSGTVELSPRMVETFGIGLPPGSVSGQGSGEFSLEFAPGKAPALALKSDLAGVGLSLPQLGWNKPLSATGSLEISGSLGPQTRIDRLVIEAAGLSATGTVLNREGGGLERALFDPVRIGDWLHATVELVGRGAAAPEVRILDGTLDMRRASFAVGGGGREGTGPMSVRLSRFQVTDTMALTGFSGQFTATGGLSGQFSGALNGQAGISGTIVPKDGRSAVRVTSPDAGAVFRAAGIFQHGWGGDFAMTLLPVGEAGHFDGAVEVRNTRVRDAPTMAALLNAVSVVGLLDEMAGQGILFTEVAGRFRLGPSRLTLLEGSAVGPSIGISMDGLYDIASSRLAMRGVISPVYLLNSIGSMLTRKGEGLIGFSYTLSGPASAPDVQVNPLSGLAPGMLRDVFRGAPPDVPAVSATPAAPAPQPKARPSGGDR